MVHKNVSLCLCRGGEKNALCARGVCFLLRLYSGPFSWCCWVKFEVLILQPDILLFLLSLHEALPAGIPQDCGLRSLFTQRRGPWTRSRGYISLFVMLFHSVCSKCQKWCTTWLLSLFHIFSVFSFRLWAEALPSINFKSQLQPFFYLLSYLCTVFFFVSLNELTHWSTNHGMSGLQYSYAVNLGRHGCKLQHDWCVAAHDHEAVILVFSSWQTDIIEHRWQLWLPLSNRMSLESIQNDCGDRSDYTKLIMKYCK